MSVLALSGGIGGAKLALGLYRMLPHEIVLEVEPASRRQEPGAHWVVGHRQ